jgi:transposase-like protein
MGGFLRGMEGVMSDIEECGFDMNVNVNCQCPYCGSSQENTVDIEIGVDNFKCDECGRTYYVNLSNI